MLTALTPWLAPWLQMLDLAGRGFQDIFILEEGALSLPTAAAQETR